MPTSKITREVKHPKGGGGSGLMKPPRRDFLRKVLATCVSSVLLPEPVTTLDESEWVELDKEVIKKIGLIDNPGWTTYTWV